MSKNFRNYVTYDISVGLITRNYAEEIKCKEGLFTTDMLVYKNQSIQMSKIIPRIMLLMISL